MELKTLKRNAICTNCREEISKGTEILFIPRYNSNFKDVNICPNCWGKVTWLIHKGQENMGKDNK